MRSTVKAAKSRLARFDPTFRVYSFSGFVKRAGVVRPKGGNA